MVQSHFSPDNSWMKILYLPALALFSIFSRPTKKQFNAASVFLALLSLLGLVFYFRTGTEAFLSPPPELFFAPIDYIPEGLIAVFLAINCLVHVWRASSHSPIFLTFSGTIMALVTVAVFLSGKTSWATYYFPIVTLVESFHYLKVSQRS